MGTATALGWAVIGCGWVARDYVVPAIRASRNGRLVALCDRDASALRDVLGGAANATRAADGAFGAAQAELVMTREAAAAIAAPGVDAVYVATPNHAHREIAEAAAAAGKHVLCEKPLASGGADARAMAAACARAGVTLATAFDQRFHAAHRKLAALVRDGRLGTVTQARLHYACWLPADWSADNWRIDPRRAGGGAVIDLAPHGLDLLETALDDRVEALVALTQHRVHDYAVEDGGLLAARLASGTLASLHVAYNCPETFPRRTLEVIGTRARALATDTMGQTAGGTLGLTDAGSGRSEAVALDDDRCPFLLQVEAFADAVLGGRPYAYGSDRDVRLATLLEAALAQAASRPASKAPTPWH